MDGEGSGTPDDLMQAQIVGIAVGSVVGGCLIIILVSVFAFCYYRCCRQVGLIDTKIGTSHVLNSKLA